MPNKSIVDRCHINTNRDSDTFVGVECNGNDYTIHFPLGFEFSVDEPKLRKEILLMLNSIARTTQKRMSSVSKSDGIPKEEGFPLQACIFLIANYMERGYYKEKDVQYRVSNQGKINWGRTIKTQKPYVQGTDAYYLKFVTRKNPVNENELITLIHEYCVYDSFQKIGWLFTSAMPAKPRIKLNKKLFSTVIKDKLQQTFNDDSRTLFVNMLALVEWLGDPDVPLQFKYGTNRYEYVWESMIDQLYGIKGKEFYFPKTTWILPKKKHDNAVLEPDSIMLIDGQRNKVFVLDAKYYKFGATGNPNDLPESTSINKQITYGEYIASHQKFKEKHGDDITIFNAFLMPFAARDAEETIQHIGEAVSEWKPDRRTYERIQGILIDVKFLMTAFTCRDTDELLRLADIIEKACVE